MSLFDRTHETTLDLVVDDIVFRRDDGRFSVVRGTRSDSNDSVTILGDLGTVTPGESLRVRGRWQQHAVYGPRFSVSAFTPITPNTSIGIARYLGSGLIAGIGPSLAERLVAKFGADTLEVITTQSARLREVSGIGAQRATSIAVAVRAKRLEADELAFLHGLGLGPSVARKLRQRYGADVVRVLRDDPYLVAEEVPGVGFRTADRIGRELGYTLDDPRRAAGAVLHLVGSAADEGHVYTEDAQLVAGASALDVPSDRAAAAIIQLAARGTLVSDDRRIYAPPLFHAETRVAHALRTLAAAAPPLATRIPNLPSLSGLAQRQQDAVHASLQSRLLVLTGGPGTGKTTTTRAIVDAHIALGRRVALCAPTGRAAKRLSEATGRDAQTIHRLLEYNPATNGWNRNSQAPLDVDTLVLDEASMLDVLLADRILSALPAAASLVLVGDADQLAPVSPGPVLRDVLASHRCPVVRLTEVFRQAQQSAIVRAAHAMLEGHVPVSSAPRNAAKSSAQGDLFILDARDPDAVYQRLKQVLLRLSRGYSLDLKRDVQVITPTRRGPLGTEALNVWLQQQVNPAPPSTTVGPGFRLGDKIMQLRNDYDREVFNGDMGIVTKFDAGVMFADIGGRQVAYQRDDLGDVTLAYASTVHKVQGSEFPAVVIILHGSHHMLLSRPLVYTAVTRARAVAVVLGDGRSFKRAIDNTATAVTRSHLRDRLSAAQ